MERDAASTDLVQLMERFVREKLQIWPECMGALIVGSIAHGEARPDSDVDCIFLFDHLDERIAPAEFVWSPATDTFHTIFEADAAAIGGIQIDATRVTWHAWLDEDWPEGLKHDLTHAIVVWDRDGDLPVRLNERLVYPDELRQQRLHEHFGRAAYYTEAWRLQAWLTRGGFICAHDQLAAAFEQIVYLLHAYNRSWLPWRYRQMIATLKLPWLPDDFRHYTHVIQTTVASTDEALWQRQGAVMHLLMDIGEKLRADGLVADPGEAFRAMHPELGYGHNMETWQRAHDALVRERVTLGRTGESL